MASASTSLRLPVALLAAVSLTFLFTLVLREITLSRTRERAMLYAFDVGQGDALLLSTPSGKQVLIDGGPDMTLLRLLGEAMPFYDRTIELVVVTHPDRDHIAPLSEILRRYVVQSVLLTGVPHDLPLYHDLLNEIRTQGIATIAPDPATDIDLGDGVVLDVVWPPTADENLGSLNNTSVVLRVRTTGSGALLSGDIEAAAEALILRTGTPIRADVLKVPHHGSRTSSSTGFLLAVAPRIALISAGEGNRYGHPHSAVLSRLRAQGIDVRSTIEDGTIAIPLGGYQE